jgi:hypothetical protein
MPYLFLVDSVPEESTVWLPLLDMPAKTRSHILAYAWVFRFVWVGVFGVLGEPNRASFLQITVIELARSQLRLANATSEEFDKEAENKVVVFMPEISKTHLGGTMRLGARKTLFQTKNSVLYKLYKVHQLKSTHSCLEGSCSHYWVLRRE